MHRITAIMVYAVIIIWAGVVLLYGVSGVASNSASPRDSIGRKISATHKTSPAPVLDRRLDSLTPLYY